MRQPYRYTIGGLMGIVLVMALDLAALRSPTSTKAGLLSLFACGVLALSVVGASCRGPDERPWWLGFAIAGCVPMGWMLLMNGSPLGRIVHEMFTDRTGMGGGLRGPLDESFGQIVDILSILIAATVWRIVAHFHFASPPQRTTATVVRPESGGDASPGWWHQPLALGLTGFVLIITALAGWTVDPAAGAGLAFLLTWGLLALTTVGAVLREGKARTVWFGATLFGVGYMILIFGLTSQRA